MGYHNAFGFPTFCDQEHEAFLHDTSEVDKLAYATAATITALVPIIIAFQKLPTANVHELVLRDYKIMAIVTAGLTFGLPVVQEPSGMAIEASEYLRDGFLLDEHGSTGHPLADLNEAMCNGIFVVLQVLVMTTPTLLNHVIKSPIRTLWGCHGNAHTLWHMLFFVPVPIVGIIWYCFLRWTHYTAGDAETNGQLVAYYPKYSVRLLDPFAKLLPGLAQMLITVYFTFLFSTIYGVSVMAALIRVMIIATFFFFSRGLNLCFARGASERHSKLLVRCESKKEAAAVLKRWTTRKTLEQQLPPCAQGRQPSCPPSPSQASAVPVARSMPPQSTRTAQSIPRT